MNLRRILILIPLLAAPLAAQPASTVSPLAGQIGDRGFLQVESPSFAKLPLQQKLLAWHLTRAAIQLDPIFYDQMSAYGLTAKRLLGALAERPERLPERSHQAIVEYATLFLANDGNHSEATGEKFLPTFSFEDLAKGDYEGGKALVTKHGTHFDPAVRDDVIARYKKLQIPIYLSGIYADLAPVKDQAGRVTDVAVSYPRDFLAQQLVWARENGTLGF